MEEIKNVNAGSENGVVKPQVNAKSNDIGKLVVTGLVTGAATAAGAVLVNAAANGIVLIINAVKEHKKEKKAEESKQKN